MKRLRLTLVLVFLVGLAACQQADQPSTLPAADAPQAPQTVAQVQAPAPQTLPPIEVYFSPKGGCTEAVVRELNAAKTSVLVQAYSFTSAPIAKALLDAHRRGVKVEVILDKSNRTKNYSAADFILHAGIPILIDAKHSIAHNKIIIIDGEVVITGSFNFTKAAETNNAENLLVIHDKAIAEKYTANWQVHAGHSVHYEGKQAASSEPASPAKLVPAPDEPTEAPAEEAAGGYVASKNSGVFHRADCAWATKIQEKNLIHFKTREEAIASGRHPCSVCKP